MFVVSRSWHTPRPCGRLPSHVSQRQRLMDPRLDLKLVLVVLAAPAGTPVFADCPGILAPGVRPELVQERGAGEGPAWHPGLGLLTSGGGDIVRRARDGTVSVYRKGAGSN